MVLQQMELQTIQQTMLQTVTLEMQIQQEQTTMPIQEIPQVLIIQQQLPEQETDK